MLRGIIMVSLVLSLAACGSSRLNPLNWFGAEREERIRIDADASAPNVAVDPRPLVAEITQLSVEQTTSGAIIRATGVTPSQGYFDASLREVERTPNGIVFEFRAAAPVGTATAGLQEISVGQELSVGELASVRSISVIAQNNRRTVSRR